MYHPTCTKRDGTPRASYDSMSAARVAVILGKQYGQTLLPYHCRICDAIHVRPAGTIEPPTTCTHCRKKGYATEKDATQVAEYRFKREGIYLTPYPCPYSDEIHLTKG